tara:strand:- start:1394 stop:1648 length:255 start_codon:yes stop_codon:yes gene_type:complete
MKNDTKFKLITIFSKIFNINIKKISLNKITNINHQNFSKWDSINKLNLIIAIEQEFKIKIKDKEIENLNSFNDALKIIKNRKKK